MRWLEPRDLAFPEPWHGLAELLAGSESCPAGRLDASGVLLAANPALIRWWGEGRGPSLDAVLDEPARARWRAALDELNRSGQPQIVELAPAADRGPGGSYRCLIRPAGDGTIWLVGEPSPGHSDAIAGRLAEAERQAQTDPLTGLPNRRQAERWLHGGAASARSAGTPMACIVADLDRFKAVNDALGHVEGDRVLCEAAQALQGTVRAADRIARLGGDEFLLVLPETDLAGARALADRLRAALADRTVAALGRALQASFGVAELRPDEPPEALLARADAALLRAKRHGRNRVEAAGPG